MNRQCAFVVQGLGMLSIAGVGVAQHCSPFSGALCSIALAIARNEWESIAQVASSSSSSSVQPQQQQRPAAAASSSSIIYLHMRLLSISRVASSSMERRDAVHVGTRLEPDLNQT